jgi:hypothetical protein
MKPVIEWLIKIFLPGHHLARNPKRQKKVKARQGALPIRGGAFVE